MKETVIQFGEGNFLRGFFDYFLHELNEKNLYDGSAVVVKPTPRGNCDVFKEQDCKYNLFLRGIENGKEVCRHTRVESISRIVNPYEDFEGFLALAKNPDFRFIVSNTTEAGIAFDEECEFSDSAPLSFPAKLTRLLYERFKCDLGGFILLACELIDNNGDELKNCVLKYIELWNLGEDFKTWVEEENTFCNTLVDRIVTGFPRDEAQTLFEQIGEEDRLLDTAEIFHLWVIEGDFEKELPLKKAGFNVVWTDDVKPYKKRKVRVLNGAHTSMVCAALTAGVETVGDCMRDGDVYAFMHRCVYDEIIKILGENEENLAFAKAVEERFKNPYIRHMLRSIALNSVSKFSVRVLPSILDYKVMFGEYPPALTFSLAALIYFYKNDTPNDDEAVMDIMKNASVSDILKNEKLWGLDISELENIVEENLGRIENEGIRSAIKWVL